MKLSTPFHKTPEKPDFPDYRDFPDLTPGEASAALGLLRLLVAAGAADVYTRPCTPAGERPRWNVWLGEQVVAGGRRIELREWAARAVCVDYDGGDAA